MGDTGFHDKFECHHNGYSTCLTCGNVVDTLAENMHQLSKLREFRKSLLLLISRSDAPEALVKWEQELPEMPMTASGV